MEDNRKTTKVFLYALAHLRYEQGEFIGLDMNYVMRLMDVFGVENKERCLKSLARLTDHYLRKKKTDAF